MSGKNLTGYLYVLAAITAWGAYFPFAKIILEKLSPTVFLIFRFGIGAVLLLLMSMRMSKSFRIGRGDILSVAAAGFIGLIVHQLVQLTGLIYTSATNTGWILTLIPPVTGLLGWKFLKESVSGRQLLGLAIAMAGVMLFVSNGNPENLSLIQNLGDLLAFLSVFSWSAYTILTKSRLSDYDPLPLSTMHLAMGFIFFLLIGGASMPAQISALNQTDWLIILAIGIIPSGLAYYWWNAGLKRLSSINTCMFLFIEAIVASVAGYLLLGEIFTLKMAVFTVIIVLGVSITQKKD